MHQSRNSRQPSVDRGKNGSSIRPGRKIRRLLDAHPDREWISWTTLTSEIDPLACIEAAETEGEFHYWEQPEEHFVIAGSGCVTRLQATGSDRFRLIADQVRQLRHRLLTISDTPHSLSEPILFGGYSFSDHNIEREWNGFGAARFTLPQWSLVRSGKLHLLTISTARNGRTADQVEEELQERFQHFQELCERIRDTETPPQTSGRTGHDAPGMILSLQPRQSYEEWKRQVETSRRMIRDGRFEKIVLARRLDVVTPQPVDISGALYHFRHRFPACYNFMVRTDTGSVFTGTSPERLVSLNSRRILTEGLAGSTARGMSAVEDLALGRKLMASSKERSEHNFVVEDIRNSLQNWSHRVNHPDEPLLKKLSNVQHLYTPITAEADREISIHELIGSLHPTPAVGGFPRERAVPHISSIEETDRGWYSGPIGWFNLSGNGEFAVAIRSALINGSRARLYAGSGIVRDSDPEREWQETNIKLRPVLEAIKPVKRDG